MAVALATSACHAARASRGLGGRQGGDESAVGESEILRRLEARYPDADHARAARCREDADSACKSAGNEVATQFGSRIEGATQLVTEHLRKNGGERLWSRYLEDIRISTTFQDAGLIRCGPEDQVPFGAAVCAVAHLRRADADAPVAAKLLPLMARALAGYRRCQTAAETGAFEEFVLALRDAEALGPRIVSLSRDRIAILGGRFPELDNYVQARMRTMVSLVALGRAARLTVRVEDETGRGAAVIGESLLASLRDAGLEATSADGDCTPGQTHSIVASASDECDPGPLESECETRIAVRGRRCGGTGDAFRVQRTAPFRAYRGRETPPRAERLETLAAGLGCEVLRKVVDLVPAECPESCCGTPPPGP